MRSRRVTKLLACVLASSICTMPVYATGIGTENYNGEKSINAEFGVNSATIKATVPTKLQVKVNPFHATTTAGTVSEQKIASNEFVISNNTSFNGVGVDLMCTAAAKVTSKAPDVQLDYRTFTPRQGATAKKVHIMLAPASGTAVSENNTYVKTAGTSAPITLHNSKLEVAVAAPNLTTGAAGYGAFAVVGDANTKAAWKDDDLAISLVYSLQTVAASETPVGQVDLGSKSVTSTNVAAGTTVIADDTQLTGAVMGDAKVAAVILHCPENDFDDAVIMAEATDELKITYTDDTTTTGTKKCKIELPKEYKRLVYMTNNLNGKKVDYVVSLTDGRRFVGELDIQ